MSFLHVITTLLLLATHTLSHDHIICRRCGARLGSTQNSLEDSPNPTWMERFEPLNDRDASFARLHSVRDPLGREFDLFLLNSTTSVRATSKASGKNSFFDGYAWKPADCATCGAFVGWVFERPAQCDDVRDHKGVKEEAGEEVEDVAADVLDEVLLAMEPLPGMVSDKGCVVRMYGFWVVEYCHLKHVRQYHLQLGVVRNPDYSLGVHLDFEEKPPSVPLVNIPGAPGPRRHHVHYFHEGQQCDETGGLPRTSKVILMCCYNYHASLNPNGGPGPFIASFSEPSVCTYELAICVPQLCQVPEYSPPVEAQAPSGSPLLVNLICKQSSPPSTSPRLFYALDWANVVAESAMEMIWTTVLTPVMGTVAHSV